MDNIDDSEGGSDGAFIYMPVKVEHEEPSGPATDSRENDTAVGHDSEIYATEIMPPLFTCYHCQSYWTSFRTLRSHVRDCFQLLRNLSSKGKAASFRLDYPSLHEIQNYSVGTLRSTVVNSLTQVKHLKTGFKRKMHTCTHCAYTTPCTSHLRQHILFKHTDSKPYACNECSYSAALSADLKRHIMSKHTKEKPHCCPYCKYSAVVLRDLKRHVASKHSNERPFPCPFCKHSAVLFKDLKRHILSVHSKQRPHSCPYCTYSAVEAALVKRHVMFKHTTSKPHSCEHCKYTTATAGNLRRHVANKHPEKTSQNPAI